MPPPSRPPDAAHGAATGVSDWLRAAVTVALGVYLIGLVLAVLGNGSSGASALIRTIKSRLYASWLVPVWLDLGHDHHLTYGLPEDADHTLELRATGDRTATPLRLPGRLTGERAARWRRLAAALAREGDDQAVALAAAVAAGSFDDLGSEDVMLRVLRRQLPDRRALPLPTGSSVVTSARVRRVGGELQLIKADPPGEVAPLVTPATQQPAADEAPR
ncbi:MAG: hypothetical protein WCC69_00325 [Pirellulales bacterium]